MNEALIKVLNKIDPYEEKVKKFEYMLDFGSQAVLINFSKN